MPTVVRHLVALRRVLDRGALNGYRGADYGCLARMMSETEIISRFEAVIRAKGVSWINGEYLRDGEVVRWECFVRWRGVVVRVGFDEYLEKYEDAIDLYDAYVREEFPDIPSALVFVLKSFPRVAEEMRK